MARMGVSVSSCLDREHRSIDRCQCDACRGEIQDVVSVVTDSRARQGITYQIEKDLAAHGGAVLVGPRELARGDVVDKGVGRDARLLKVRE